MRITTKGIIKNVATEKKIDNKKKNTTFTLQKVIVGRMESFSGQDDDLGGTPKCYEMQNFNKKVNAEFLTSLIDQEVKITFDLEPVWNQGEENSNEKCFYNLNLLQITAI